MISFVLAFEEIQFLLVAHLGFFGDFCYSGVVLVVFVPVFQLNVVLEHSLVIISEYFRFTEHFDIALVVLVGIVVQGGLVHES